MNAPFKFIATTVLGVLVVAGCGNNKSSDMVSDEVYALSEMQIPEADEVQTEMRDYDCKVQEESSPMNTKQMQQSQQTVRFTPPTVQGAPALSANFIATAAAISNNDGKHQLVRTARLRFKVKDVVQATAAIENIILKNQGLIMNSSISNTKHTDVPYLVSKDSSLLVSYYELNSNLSLRVSKELLDQTLREIAPYAIEIDYRTLHAEDETFNILWNKMTEDRKLRKANRLGSAIASRSGKLGDAVDAEESRDYAEEQVDRMKLANVILHDKIDFSNIEIQLYQDRTEVRTMIANQADITAYEPGFGQKAIDGLAAGWWAICSLVLFLVSIWPVVLVLAVGAIIFIRYRRSRKG